MPESYPRAHSGQRGCSSTQPLDPHSSHELVHAVWVLVVWSLCKVFNYVSGHLHEVKQAEAVHHKLLLFITTQLDVLVQPAPLRFPATAEFALVFALPCRAIPCWEPGAYFAESFNVLDNTSVFAPDPQLLLSLLVLGSRP